MTARIRFGWGILLVLSALAATVTTPRALALITGGEGNTPIGDPGWPAGAAVIFNVKARIAYWEGPPFGGGQWHCECRGDAKALNAVLADFAKLEVKSKRIVLHNGIGSSFWLNMNKEPAKQAAAQMDWSFMVWQPDSWKRLRQLPADLNPTDAGDAKDGPPAQIDVYTGGNIKWPDVTIPKGLAVLDERLEAHGFSPADGCVFEGKITDATNQAPLAAKMRLELIEPQTKGGYHYKTVANVTADALGHWVLKNIPKGWLRVVIEENGYAPHVIGYVMTDDQPGLHVYNGALARTATVSGRICDDAGQPLADVEVRLQDIATSTGARYELAKESTVKTDADGRFRAEQAPVGKARIWVHKPGYCRPGLGQRIEMPNENVSLTMVKAGRIVVTVDFIGNERPAGYLVSLEPEGGNEVGSFGGSGNIDPKSQMTFENVPPARYIVRGQPNPGSADQKAGPVTIDLKGGQTAEIKLRAK